MTDEVGLQATRIAPEKDFVDMLDDALGKLTKAVVAGNREFSKGTARDATAGSSLTSGQRPFGVHLGAHKAAFVYRPETGRSLEPLRGNPYLCGACGQSLTVLARRAFPARLEDYQFWIA